MADKQEHSEQALDSSQNFDPVKILEDIARQAAEPENFRQSRRNKVAAGIELSVLGAEALGFAGLLYWITVEHEQYMATLQALDSVYDGAGDLMGVGERAERDKAIVEQTQEAVKKAEISDKSLKEIVALEDAKEYVAALPPDAQQKLQERIDALRQKREEHKKILEGMKPKIRLYEENTKDLGFKYQRLKDELESILKKGHEAQLSVYDKNENVKGVLELMDAMMGKIQRIDIKEAREARADYLKSANDLYKSLDTIKRVLEGASKEHGLNEGDLNGLVEAYENGMQKILEMSENNLKELKDEYTKQTQQQKDLSAMMEKLAKINKQLETTLETGSVVKGGLERANTTYDTGRDLQSTKGTSQEGSAELEQRVGQEVTSNTAYVDANKQYAVQESLFGFDSSAPITGALVTGYLIAAAIVYAAATKLTGYIRKNDPSGRRAQKTLKNIETIAKTHGNQTL